mmetsp:Transcript_10558/g.26642  ORF Transcript_10558/g.26642 Transcript_10558/m.26642 type:complete len:249 (-) Transcript_10558:131-877(-)|eukprot:CAMPEP_0116095846 /NCGR_PEP_ID=MMETSP0327-20121206/9878_1 /TAXON_ID=44447 /ORGANISM="Pseudo-nitzschia delicatissima, Strain B596" /LENGTH=248 /DNA_ID=CAMNT_0003587535 /DNA_START=49 /DNA_END=795 /DNA_ORIENTATION=+
MSKFSLLFVSLVVTLSSVDAFSSMAKPLSKTTSLRAEVGDMPTADISAVAPEESAPVPAFIPETATSTDTGAQLILPNEFAPPKATTLIDPDGPQPPPMPPVNDLDTIALVAGQETYGFAIVLLGEAIWSFSKSPSVDHGVKTLLPAIVAAGILGVVSGPMVTSGDAASVSTGLFVATGVSVAMGLCYAARLSAPYSPSPKEIPALGLLVALAGFFSFSQNLVYDGFVKLPQLPSIPLPTLPSIPLPF